jgi:hypothetical protein
VIAAAMTAVVFVDLTTPALRVSCCLLCCKESKLPTRVLCASAWGVSAIARAPQRCLFKWCCNKCCAVIAAAMTAVVFVDLTTPARRVSCCCVVSGVSFNVGASSESSELSVDVDVGGGFLKRKKVRKALTRAPCALEKRYKKCAGRKKQAKQAREPKKETCPSDPY